MHRLGIFANPEEFVERVGTRSDGAQRSSASAILSDLIFSGVMPNQCGRSAEAEILERARNSALGVLALDQAALSVGVGIYSVSAS